MARGVVRAPVPLCGGGLASASSSSPPSSSSPSSAAPFLRFFALEAAGLGDSVLALGDLPEAPVWRHPEAH